MIKHNGFGKLHTVDPALADTSIVGVTSKKHTINYRYVVRPGPIKMFGITVMMSGVELAKRYGVDYSECIIEHLETPRVPQEYIGLPRLEPREDGDYSLSKAVARWEASRKLLKRKHPMNPGKTIYA